MPQTPRTSYERLRNACRDGDLVAVKQLHAAGEITNLFLADEGESFPQTIAASAGHLEIVQWFFATFRDSEDHRVQLTSGEFRMLAEAAAESGQLSVVKWIYETADRQPEHWGRRLLQQFAYSNHIEGLNWALSQVGVAVAKELLDGSKFLAKPLSPEVVELLDAAAQIHVIGGTYDDLCRLRELTSIPKSSLRL